MYRAKSLGKNLVVVSKLGEDLQTAPRTGVAGRLST
jgi:hypothetical protein